MPEELEASVIIPTRNRPAHLRAAVRSVLANIGNNIEVIVVDDGSVPPAQDGLLADFATDRRLMILCNSGPNGAATARNLGAAHARGKVLFFLDDDDLMLPGYCNLVLAAMDGRDLPWGFSPILQHGKGGPDPWKAPHSLRLEKLSKPLGCRHLTGLGCGFWVQSALFRSSGGLDAEFRVNEDTEYCLRLLSQGHQPWISDRPGVSVLRHGPVVKGEERSVTRETHASLRTTYFAKILDRYRSFLEVAPNIEQFLVRRYLKTLAKIAPIGVGLAAAKRYRVRGARRYFMLNWVLYRLTLRRSDSGGSKS